MPALTLTSGALKVSSARFAGILSSGTTTARFAPFSYSSRSDSARNTDALAVAVVAGGVAPGLPLDVVRRGALPGRHVVEGLEAVLAVEVEDLLVGGLVPHEDVLLVEARPRVVEADLEGLRLHLVHEVGDARCRPCRCGSCSSSRSPGSGRPGTAPCRRGPCAARPCRAPRLVAPRALRQLRHLVARGRAPSPEACISPAGWQAMQSIPFFARCASPSPRSPEYSSPTRLPWQAMHWLTMSGFFWKTWPLTKPLLANFGRLTWHWPQLEWQGVQWFLRPWSTTVSQFCGSSPARARSTLREGGERRVQGGRAGLGLLLVALGADDLSRLAERRRPRSGP